MEDSTDTEKSLEPDALKELPTSGYGLFSVVLGAIFFGSMVVFSFNAGIITLASESGIFETEPILGILTSYLSTGGPASIIGIAFGIAGFRQSDRSNILPIWGLVLNFINLNGALLCFVVINL